MDLVVAAVLAVISQVTDVTVYSDRAQVTRTAEVQLTEGLNQLRFEDLPFSVDSRGIQVSGLGRAVLLDVRLKTENMTELPRAEWNALQLQLETLNREIERVQKRIAAYLNTKNFLFNISEKVTSTDPKTGAPELDPAVWRDMLEMQLSRRQDYDASIREAEKELKELYRKKEKIQADLKTAGADMNRRQKVVEVDVEADQAGPATLKLSYLVKGPGWTPSYDVRVDTESRRMGLKYYALVRQNTGEDWGNVSVKLSTANPGLGGQHPELQPWRIRPAAPLQESEVLRYPQSWSVDAGQRTAPVITPEEWDDALSASSAEKLVRRGAQVGIQGTAVVFAVDGRSNIESDNAEHRVAIGEEELPAYFRYSTVPKMNAAAYLKARSSNVADYPLLAGKANIFLDGSYVAASDLEFVPPGEDFWVFLGVDRGITVEHKLIKKYESAEGFRGRRTRYTYEYLLTVKNARDKEAEFIIWDHLPISGNEEVEVKLLEPRFSQNSDALTLDESNRLQWLRTLDAGATLEIPFSFYVEMPGDVQVEGIE
jgi:uncharacterized protein (TIGR02231 family)